MRGLFMSALAAIFLIATLGGLQTAQAASSSSPEPVSAASAMSIAALPETESAMAPWQWGDYQQTCSDIRRNGSMLYARCQKRDGGWRSTSLDTRGCRSGIVNDNGNLHCTQGGGGRPPWGGGGWNGGIPPGDYRQTCSNVRVSGQRLDASCQRMNGGWRNTSLNNWQRCGNAISNVDGHLRCGR